MIDPRALREALINAFIHNDYTKEISPLIEIYSDRLCISSYGGLVEGLSVEEFFSGRSMPRNRELMRIFRDLNFVEHLGSGMNRILQVYDRNIFKLSENFLEVVFPLSTSTPQVTPQVKNLLETLEQNMSKIEIQRALGLKDRKNFEEKYLNPALKQGLIEMTIPNKPKSSNQKYNLSSKGAELRKLTVKIH